jgi:phospholipid transport system substrate-binding protein
MSLHRAVRACVALGLALLITAPVQAQQGEAATVVGRFYDVLLSVMRDADGLGFTGRFRALAPAVVDAYNLEVMARYTVTSRHWRQMAPQQQQRFVDAFTRYVVAVYADRFDGYSGERLEVLGEHATPKDSMVVQTQIVKSNGQEVRIDYLLQPTTAGWRIVDVFLKGAISELATRRSEYVSVIKRRGYDGLIAAIEQQTQKISAGA